MTKIFIVVTILGIDFENTSYWCTFMVFSVRHANGGFQIALSTTLDVQQGRIPSYNL
jgi:hypothetical protein